MSKGKKHLKTCEWCKHFKPYKKGPTFRNGFWVGDGRCAKHKAITVVGESCEWFSPDKKK